MRYGTDVTARVESIRESNGFFKYKLIYRGRPYLDLRRECLTDIKEGDTVLCDRGFTITESMKLTIRRKI